ncbi:hypothetical protein OZ668_10585 [Elizabethkingia sp. HX XZB]|uniref:hypothetical protein n=1 Tax=Elizabethkingia sp. HX XZB TaxID=3003193 RepID=UPI002A23CF09|nr:hypothetical protein [Elizabethkingia sp. HX XZB]MDX8568436.1 hypothetical protein [Elizabethkingia sp. HX XZB]
MIVLNIVARIAEDKNFFLDVIEIIHRFNKKKIDIKLNLVGEIYSEKLFEKLQISIKEYDLEDKVHFTKTSIPLATYCLGRKDELYLNFSVGNFFGYSAIECFLLGLKTLLLNVDIHYSSEDEKDFIFCSTIDSLEKKLLNIARDEDYYSAIICEDVENNLKKHKLIDDESHILVAKSLKI